MKKLLFALVLVIVLASSAFASLPSVTMLSTTTCPACTQMEKVLKQVDSKKITTSHIFLEENPDIARKYNVRYVPTLIFRDSEGNEVAQKVGYMSLKDLLNVFKSAGVKI
ncbi:MAG: thioredoxin family protein [Synergistaceae bacterium]|nr:thioredoxin family protein [Synergistaceae bacterium]MBQ9404395.1 thioredoxin family protein [Synergistaceae bacterium]MBQ9594811.1 thioredoxin family protein [Synergistaceae bacterium]